MSVDVDASLGAVELLLRWRYAAMAVGEEAAWAADGAAPSGKPPNRLEVVLIQAKKLRAMDPGLFGSKSSDPIMP